MTGDEFLVRDRARMRRPSRPTTCSPGSAVTSSSCCSRTSRVSTRPISAARRGSARRPSEPMVLSDGHELVASVSAGLALDRAGPVGRRRLAGRRRRHVRGEDARRRHPPGLRSRVSMGTRSSSGSQIEAALRKGLERDELEVHYQPFYTSSRTRHRRRRSAGALATSGHRPARTGQVHPHGRGDRPDHARRAASCSSRRACEARSIRDRLGVQTCRSASTCPRASSRTASLLPSRGGRPGRQRAAAGAADLRDHRDHGHGRPGRRP